jgi:hypothetical protein
MLGSGSGVFDENRLLAVNRQIRSPARSVKYAKYAQTACESAISGFDAGECGDYVVRS